MIQDLIIRIYSTNVLDFNSDNFIGPREGNESEISSGNSEIYGLMITSSRGMGSHTIWLF